MARQLVTVIKRGDIFIGRLIKDSTNPKYLLEVEYNGKIITEEAASLDEDESEMLLNKLMNDTYREFIRPHPQARRKV